MDERVVAVGRGWRAALGAALALLLTSSPAPCMLAGPTVQGLAVGATEVAVRVGARVFFFDHEGSFRRELSTSELPLKRAHLLALTEDGRLWLAISDEDEEGHVKASTLAALDESGGVVFRRRLTGDWTFYVSPRGSAFAGQVEAKRLRVERFDPPTNRLMPHAEVGIEKALRILDLDTASAVAWAVDEQGDLVVLTTAAERGRVTRYHPSGVQVRVWDVLPEPVTSVSYLKDVLLDRDGVPYVTHSSWEVSSSIGNDGSVIRLDPVGAEALRIKEGIGYLQHAGISPSGDVFVSDLSEEIFRFSSAGERVLSWVAVPPPPGVSWEERRQRIAEARRIGPSSTVAELVNALVYGDYDVAQRAGRSLIGKGDAAVPEVSYALARLGRRPGLWSTADALWEAHPEAVAKLFEGTDDESLKRVLAPHLGYVNAPPTGVRELLSRMALEGDESARHSLNHLGPPPEVVQARIAEFRKAQRTGTTSFDAEWDLEHSYAWSISALATILENPADPDRRAVRGLMLEASLELTGKPNGKRRPAPADVVTRTQRWVIHPDAFVRQTGAIALTSLGIGGHEVEAIAAGRHDPALILPALKAFAVLAAAQPDAVTPHAQALSTLARSAKPTESTDALGEFARIPHAAVEQTCLRLLTDETLAPTRRAAVLSGLKPSALPRSALIALLYDQTWQRALVNEYSYRSFFEDLVKAYPEDSDIRTEAKNALLGLLSDARNLTKPDSAQRRDACAVVLSSLRPLVAASDLPRLMPLLDDPALDHDSRWQLLRLVSGVSPDDDLRERLIPLLKDPDSRLLAAQSLGRVGYPAALDVLVDQGLKRLGSYSDVELDVESFRPLGAEAEQALLSLLDYPNTGTRDAVRRFLVQWPSSEGRRLIRAEFDEAIQAGRAPESYNLNALALAGEDLVEALRNLGTEHPDAIASLAPSYGESPLSEQLRRALAKESDPDRARTLSKLIKQICSCESE